MAYCVFVDVGTARQLRRERQLGLYGMRRETRVELDIRAGLHDNVPDRPSAKVTTSWVPTSDNGTLKLKLSLSQKGRWVARQKLSPSLGQSVSSSGLSCTKLSGLSATLTVVIRLVRSRATRPQGYKLFLCFLFVCSAMRSLTCARLLHARPPVFRLTRRH